jgi:chromate reductase
MDNNRPVRMLAISGSLRQGSSNTALIEAAARLARSPVHIAVFYGLAAIPPFNPDLDEAGTPGVVSGFRSLAAACDALMISSPEYAHGVPGVVKNALDWLVGSGELVGKPVALLNASTRATRAWASLAETLTVMSARVILDASLTIPVQGQGVDASGIVTDTGLSRLLRSAIEALADATHDVHVR